MAGRASGACRPLCSRCDLHALGWTPHCPELQEPGVEGGCRATWESCSQGPGRPGGHLPAGSWPTSAQLRCPLSQCHQPCPRRGGLRCAALRFSRQASLPSGTEGIPSAGAAAWLARTPHRAGGSATSALVGRGPPSAAPHPDAGRVRCYGFRAWEPQVRCGRTGRARPREGGSPLPLVSPVSSADVGVLKAQPSSESVHRAEPTAKAGPGRGPDAAQTS